MKKKTTQFRSYKVPPSIISKGKGLVQLSSTKDIKSQPLALQTEMKSLESQGLQAIQMLKEMNSMLDMQVSYGSGASRPSEQLEKARRKETDKEGKEIKEIQNKNKQIRSILDEMNGGGESIKGYGQLLQLEAVFGNKEEREDPSKALEKVFKR